MIPTCEEVTRLISDSLDRNLPLRKRVAVWIHFLGCRFCRRYRRQLLLIRRAIRGLTSRMDDVEPPLRYSLSPEAGEKIKRSLESSGK